MRAGHAAVVDSYRIKGRMRSSGVAARPTESEEATQPVLVDQALIDQQVAQVLPMPFAFLQPGQLGELVVIDHLEVDGDATEQRCGAGTHGLLLIGRRGFQCEARGGAKPGRDSTPRRSGKGRGADVASSKRRSKSSSPWFGSWWKVKNRLTSAASAKASA